METTYFLDNLINQCDDLGMFREEVLPKMPDMRQRWMKIIQQIMDEHGYSKTELAALCGVSRPAVAKWCSGALPSNREDYLRIGFAAGYDYNEMNFFLQRYGRYPGLYAKSLEDSVCIFVLTSEGQEKTFANVQAIFEELRSILKTQSGGTYIPVDTYIVDRDLRSMHSKEELYRFLSRNAPIFQDAYGKFYDYVISWIVANNADMVSDRQLSVHALAEAQSWSSSLRQCVSAIRQRTWFPLRRKVIVLGLHLNMNVDQINEMLDYARMEPLCAKNPVEGAIIFAVTDADLNNMIYRDGGTELCEHVRMVLESLEIEGADQMLRDL